MNTRKRITNGAANSHAVIVIFWLRRDALCRGARVRGGAGEATALMGCGLLAGPDRVGLLLDGGDGLLRRRVAACDLLQLLVDDAGHLCPRGDGRRSLRVFELLGEDAQVRVRSEEHTSELQSLMRISYAVFSLQ